jgi:hypothetical protein
MIQHYGFSDGTYKVCPLQKGVYGLKQSPRQWSIKVTEIFKNLGFQCLERFRSISSRIACQILDVLFIPSQGENYKV